MDGKFNFSIDNFWGQNHFAHPALTNEMISVAESKFGVTLPTEYVDLLRVQNGGYTQGFVFPTKRKTSWASNHVPLNELAGIVVEPSIETAQNILESENLSEEWGLPSEQILLAGDGHWWITLDYRNGSSPTVAWIDMECDEYIQLAPSFAAFLNGLIPIEEAGSFLPMLPE